MTCGVYTRTVLQNVLLLSIVHDARPCTLKPSVFIWSQCTALSFDHVYKTTGIFRVRYDRWGCYTQKKGLKHENTDTTDHGKCHGRRIHAAVWPYQIVHNPTLVRQLTHNTANCSRQGTSMVQYQGMEVKYHSHKDPSPSYTSHISYAL